MTAEPIVPGDLFARHQTITGLRALADFLEANPAVPVDEYGDFINVYTRTGSEQEQRAQVDQVAEHLGVPVEDDTARGGHCTATKRFGRITYKIVYIPADYTAAHRARMSYVDNVRLDDTGRAA